MRKLKILAPTRYPWRFNSPRHSRHDISVRRFVPFNRIWGAVEGVTIFNPLPPRRFDLIHAFNRIPLGVTPFVIGYESHLPRCFSAEDGMLFPGLASMLVSDRCRGIVAISHYARQVFLRQHAGRPWAAALEAKLVVRYPNVDLPPLPAPLVSQPGEPVRMVFVGAHFARKGGLVCLRLAERAHREGFPIHIDIVSALEMGEVSWVDPLRPSFYDKDRALLATLPNVTLHGAMSNADVLKLVGKAHFVLLPTFADTFGFSAIEAMAMGTPPIVTNQGALPEFVQDGRNGIMLPFETNGLGDWIHSSIQDRTTRSYESLFRDAVDRTGDTLFERLQALPVHGQTYAALRREARLTAERMFSSHDATEFWDNLYERCADGPLRRADEVATVPKVPTSYLRNAVDDLTTARQRLGSSEDGH